MLINFIHYFCGSHLQLQTVFQMFIITEPLFFLLILQVMFPILCTHLIRNVWIGAKDPADSHTSAPGINKTKSNTSAAISLHTAGRSRS